MRLIRLLILLAAVCLLDGCSSSVPGTEGTLAQKLNEGRDSEGNSEVQGVQQVDVKDEELEEGAVILNEESKTALVKAYREKLKAKEKPDSVHAVLIVHNADEVKGIKAYAGSLCGVVSTFEVRFTEALSSPVVADLSAICDERRKLIFSGSSNRDVVLGPVRLNATAAEVEIRNLTWKGVGTPGSLITVTNAEHVVFDSVRFEDLKVESKRPYTDQPIVVMNKAVIDEDVAEGEEPLFVPESAKVTIRHSAFKGIINWNILNVEDDLNVTVHAEEVTVEDVRVPDGDSNAEAWKSVSSAKQIQ